MQTLLKMPVFLVFAFLSACGGGGGSPGQPQQQVVLPGGNIVTPVNTGASNKAPVVADINMDVATNVVTVITPQVTDDSPPGSYTITVPTLPKNGSVTVTDFGRSLTYISNAGFEGQDSLEFVVTDYGGASTKATATLNVFPMAKMLIRKEFISAYNINRVSAQGNYVYINSVGRASSGYSGYLDDTLGLISSRNYGDTFDNNGGIGTSHPDPLPQTLPLLEVFVSKIGSTGYGIYSSVIYDGKLQYVSRWDRFDLGRLMIAPHPIAFGGLLILEGTDVYSMDMSGTLYVGQGGAWSSVNPAVAQVIDSRVSIHKSPIGKIHILANDSMSGFYHTTYDPQTKILANFQKIAEPLPVDAKNPYRKKDTLVFSGQCIYFPYKDASAGLHILKSCDNGSSWTDIFVSAMVSGGTLDMNNALIQRVWMDPITLSLYAAEESQIHRGYVSLMEYGYDSVNGIWSNVGIYVTGIFFAENIEDAYLSLENRELHTMHHTEYRRISFK
ncbi:Ig-like domain-containing protein [Candidatus Azambacteria bacterium]|nr:Ig-like domain-containing protein [Candidatus Azambacteria bacterium]